MSFTLEERRAHCGSEHVRASSDLFGETAHDGHPAMFLSAGTENGSRHREALLV